MGMTRCSAPPPAVHADRPTDRAPRCSASDRVRYALLPLLALLGLAACSIPLADGSSDGANDETKAAIARETEAWRLRTAFTLGLELATSVPDLDAETRARLVDGIVGLAIPELATIDLETLAPTRAGVVPGKTTTLAGAFAAREAGATSLDSLASSDADASRDGAAGIAAVDDAIAIALQNLQHVDTIGYKRRSIRSGSTSPTWTQGPLQITNRQLDIALDGPGVLTFAEPSGDLVHRRSGVLFIAPDGRLVDDAGRPLVPEIVLPEDSLQICVSPLGEVAVLTASAPDTSTLVGQVLVAWLRASAHVVERGPDLWQLAEGSEPLAQYVPGSLGVASLQQGFVEVSNVEVAHELAMLRTLTARRRALVRATADVEAAHADGRD
jgi:flagellar basal body rod protein FlgF